jgi:hypothetical protein
MDEMIAEAEEKSQRIMDDAIARRRQLNLAISSLIDRRDEIAADATRLAEELLTAVDDLSRPDSRDEDVAPVPVEEPLTPAPDEPAEEERTDDEEVVAEEETGEALLAEEETEVHPGPDSDQSEIVEDDNPEAHRPSTLLVDPDEED